VITQLRHVNPTADSTATPEAIITRTRRATSEGQPDYRASTEALNRTGHSQGNKRQYTPRHPDLTVILPGPSGPVGKIELQAPTAVLRRPA
jgi:hypothetical protein